MNAGATGEQRDYGKVAVLMGGLSAEREISLQSGAAVLAALQSAGVDAQGVDTGEAGFQLRLLDGAYTRAFIALHGRGGEDGVIQGMLETAGLAYTGSGVLGSALAMDKLRTKQVWQSAGISTPDFWLVTTRAEAEAVCDSLPYPVIIKPAHEGSSIGISKVETAGGLVDAWERAARYDTQVLIERWITGGEYTAGILGETVLPLIRLETPNVFYDYAAKYQADTTRYLVPCGLDDALETRLQAQALAAFLAVGASGWGRVDFMLDEAGRAWFIEVNTVPGLTDHSLVPMAAKAEGIDFTQLVLRILDTAVSRQVGEVMHA
ncbi:MAG: D-alanine--D-alanine ligase [Gammaproteobacteria bacterium]